jgi:hypothetical protein
MGKFTEHDVLLQIAKQDAFGALAASPNGRVVPIARGSQGFDHNRNKIENDARYADGYEREFALGNHTSMGELPHIANFDYFGFPLYGLCGTETNIAGVRDITVTAGGSAYTTATAGFSGGGGTGAAATVNLSGGVVVSLTITNPGSGYTSAPTIAISGDGTGATATATIGTESTMKPGKIVIPYTGEEQIGTNYYQYFDQVYSDLKIDFDVEGMFKPNFSTKGTGLFAKATSSMDATPTEIAGAPGEMINWGTLEDGANTGEVTKCSLSVTRELIEVRPDNKGGVAESLLVGSIKIAITLSALFQNDTRWANARNGVLMAFESTLTRGWRKLYFKCPELKFVPKAVKKSSGQPLMMELEASAIVASDALSPITFKHTSAITAHNT